MAMNKTATAANDRAYAKAVLADEAYDKLHGIVEGSPADIKLDDALAAKYGQPDPKS